MAHFETLNFDMLILNTDKTCAYETLPNALDSGFKMCTQPTWGHWLDVQNTEQGVYEGQSRWKIGLVINQLPRSELFSLSENQNAKLNLPISLEEHGTESKGNKF